MKKVKYADLHNHTTASDGLYTPRELVIRAKVNGMNAIGVTDHDTTGGLKEAIKAGREHGVEIIPGVELSAQEEEFGIHILGYFIDYSTPWFQSMLKNIRDSRYIRAKKIVENLVRIYGMDIRFSEILNQVGSGGNIGRAHIARIMVNKGIVQSVPQAFDKYIGEDCPAYEKRCKITVLEGIEYIRNIGGVPVLAHPGLVGNDDIVNKVLTYGFLGIEAYHSKHTEKQTEYYINLAKEKGLLITGGSDCHGEVSPTVGDIKVEYERVKALKRVANSLS